MSAAFLDIVEVSTMVRPGLPPATEELDQTGPDSVCLENGRGERLGADTTSPVLLIPVTNVPSHVCRASGIAQGQQQTVAN
jgi:hypothetical protein